MDYFHSLCIQKNQGVLLDKLRLFISIVQADHQIGPVEADCREVVLSLEISKDFGL